MVLLVSECLVLWWATDFLFCTKGNSSNIRPHFESSAPGQRTKVHALIQGKEFSSKWLSEVYGPLL